MTNPRPASELAPLRIGLDLDDTITLAPEVFGRIADALLLAGHEVHIITYRPDSDQASIARELDELGVPRTAIHRPDGFGQAPAPWKRDVCTRLGVHLLIDDDTEVAHAVAAVAVSLRVIAPDTDAAPS